ncbi:hypothetical protein [Paenibacillus solani]
MTPIAQKERLPADTTVEQAKGRTILVIIAKRDERDRENEKREE